MNPRKLRSVDQQLGRIGLRDRFGKTGKCVREEAAGDNMAF